MIRLVYLSAVLCLTPGYLCAQMTVANRPDPITLPARPSVGAVPAVSGASGDWRQWRGNAQHTGYQRMAGKMLAPAVRWRYPIGGRLDQSQAMLCSVAGRQPFLLAAPTGHLAAYSLDGALLWQGRNALTLSLLGCFDFGGDGRTTILASVATTSGTSLYFLDGRDGRLIWASPMSLGNLGSVKVTALQLGGGLNLLWLPAASSTLSVYGFPSGWSFPTLVWSAAISDFVSDPYSPSALAVGDVMGDGNTEIVVSGARASVPTLILDGVSGRELYRSYVSIEGHGSESGGAGQLVVVTSLDVSAAPGPSDIVTVSGYNSGETYMFQGITVTKAGSSLPIRYLDTFPVGLHYARGSVRDLDGDGQMDVLASRWRTDLGLFELELIDTDSLDVKTSVTDFYLLSVAELPDAAHPLILGWQGVGSETPSGVGQLVAYRFSGSGFVRSAWNPGIGTLATLKSRAYDEAAHENPGDSVVLIDDAGVLAPAILAYRLDAGSERAGLRLLDAETGAAQAEYAAPAGVTVSLVAVSEGPSAGRRFVLAGTDGSLVFLDRNLKQVATVAQGGYFQAFAANGHSYETAVAVDLDGRGKNDVVLVDSRSRVVRLSGVDKATPLEGPTGTVLWDAGTSQELVAVPTASGVGARLLVRGWRAAQPVLAMLDGAGRSVWRHVFGGARETPPEDGLPLGLNLLRSSAKSVADVVCSVPSGPAAYRTLALDGATGQTLWASDDGTYWDATIATADLGGDGQDDLVFNYNAQKGIVLDGRTGALRATPVVLPTYQNLGSVDYNGAPMLIGARAGGFQFLNAGDDAHLSLLAAPTSANFDDPGATAALWNIEQASPDDERQAMPALAPSGNGDWIVGVPSQSGVLKAVGSDGSERWRVGLWNGVEVPHFGVQHNPLSSVAAVDVDGDGRTDFLVGGTDGWLYAVNGATGELLWSLDFGAPVGDPIVADIDGNGLSEVLVPVGDGYLYAVGPKNLVLAPPG